VLGSVVPLYLLDPSGFGLPGIKSCIEYEFQFGSRLLSQPKVHYSIGGEERGSNHKRVKVDLIVSLLSLSQKEVGESGVKA